MSNLPVCGYGCDFYDLGVWRMRCWYRNMAVHWTSHFPNFLHFPFCQSYHRNSHFIAVAKDSRKNW